MGIRVRDGITPKLKRMRRATSPAIGRTLEKIGANMEREIDKNLTGRVLHERSGTLRASWFWSAQTERIVGGWRMAMGSPVAYARIHERGGWTGRGHKTWIPRRPYLKPAIISQQGRIIRAFQGMLMTIRRFV